MNRVKAMRNAKCRMRNEKSKTGLYQTGAPYTRSGTDNRLTQAEVMADAYSASFFRVSVVKIAFSILMMFLLLLFTSPAHAALSGRDVFEKVHEVGLKARDHKIEMTMILFDKGGGKRTRTLTSYGKKADPEAYKTLAIFKSPPDLKNVGFLVHAHTFSDRGLWAYFPEYKRVRRIANTSQDDSFFGSDLSYDDFSGPANLDDFKFRILPEEAVDGKPCYVIEVTPKTHRKYTKYISWVAKDLWIQLKIDYYQDKDIYRSGVFKDIRLIDQIPTAFQSEMENKKTKHRTEITVESAQYNTHFSDGLFTQRSLERAGK